MGKVAELQSNRSLCSPTNCQLYIVNYQLNLSVPSFHEVSVCAICV